VDGSMDAKRLGLIALALVAVVIAGIVIWKTVQSNQIQVVKTVDAGTGTNPKVLYMKAQKEAQASGGAQKDPNAAGDTAAKDPNAAGDK